MEGDAERRVLRARCRQTPSPRVCVCVCVAWRLVAMLASLGDDVRLSCTQHSALDRDTCSPTATTGLTAAAAAAAAAGCDSTRPETASPADAASYNYE